MNKESRGLYLAVALSIIAIFLTDYLFPKKEVPVEAVSATTVEQEAPRQEAKKEEPQATERAIISTDEALKKEARIGILNKSLHGSIRIKGARIDNLFLSKYDLHLNDNTENVELFSPSKTETPYYAEFGWTSSNKAIKLPNDKTIWEVKGNQLTPDSPIVMEWNNGAGLKFIRKISIDDNYMFSIEQSVENNSSNDVVLYPYGLINRHHPEAKSSSSVVHEGLIGVVNSTLKEEKYKDIKDDKKVEFETKGGWAGFTDRYWFSAIIFNNEASTKVKFSNPTDSNFQVDYLGEPITVGANSVKTSQTRLFAGAKEIKLIDKYAKAQNIDKFDLSVDFGWYYFLTKPFFYILDFLYHVIGNMGWAILLFAALLRLVMFPVASKSFDSMSKMKKLQPKMQEIQERFKDDKLRIQQETMALYKKEKINPAAGCLPLLIQIPVFFSLYKVLNIAIEIRHAPFVGWIKDLSAPDPLTLSVMLHIPVPGLINIGLWPIVMGLTMWIQQKLNPAPANKDQARVFALMPIIFTFMMGHFASGLVIYWTLSNVLSIIQQKAIMKRNGVQ